jgi:CO dehydrogenase maturation factor
MDIGDLPLVAAIEADKELAACDMKGENVFYLPENAKIVEGARKALVNMEILG